jgi:cell division protein FtsQ
VLAGGAIAGLAVAGWVAIDLRRDDGARGASALVRELTDRAMFASGRVGLAVREIRIEGRTETSLAEVLAAVEIQRGAPILAFDPSAARTEIEKLPWVARASVERRLPDTIVVRLGERVPLALWQHRGVIAVIDRQGEEIRGAEAGRFAHLPLVVGADASKHAAALVALLATEPDIEKRVAAAVRVGGRRWTLRLDDRIDVHLPEENLGAAWTRLAELIRAEGLMDRNVTVVDLRLPDRLILRTVREAPPAAKPTRGAGRPT